MTLEFSAADRSRQPEPACRAPVSVPEKAAPRSHLLHTAIYNAANQTHASVCERFSVKASQCGMKFSMKRKRGRREAAKAMRLRCDCDATSPYSSSYSRTRVSHTHPV
ncbi:hypothetical protein Y032_0277g1122 [Ancylostoma ceylanicum]|nr:hypothetical protein Y032_0277g1122 [Ancylostoma ceylanicum]